MLILGIVDVFLDGEAAGIILVVDAASGFVFLSLDLGSSPISKGFAKGGVEGFCDGLDFGEGVLGAAEGGVLGEEGVLVIAEAFMGEVSSSDDFVLGEIGAGMVLVLGQESIASYLGEDDVKLWVVGAVDGIAFQRALGLTILIE